MNPAIRSHSSQQAQESLRERKKRMTREAIFAAAEKLFDERGFGAVTVAEIADAANISVKTLFTYIGAKEELLFSGRPAVLDAVVAAVSNRRVGQTPLVAAAQALLTAVDDQDQATSLDGFLRMVHAGPDVGPVAGPHTGPAAATPAGPHTGPAAGPHAGPHVGSAARSRLRALWDETEDALAEALTTKKDGPRELAARRLTAAQIMVLVRTVTSAEVADLIAKSADTDKQRREALKDWIRDAGGRLARGLQAAAR